MKNRSDDEHEDHQEVPGLAALAPETVKRLLEAGRLVHIPKGWTPIHDRCPRTRRT